MYIREGYHFSLVCTFSLAIENFEVKVDLLKKKMALRFRGRIDNRCVSFIQFIVSYGNSLQ